MSYLIWPRRAARFDELDLRRAFTGGLIPILVAAMAFLCSIAIAGFIGTVELIGGWEVAAGSVLTVQIPSATGQASNGSKTRLQAVQELLNAAPGVEAVDVLSKAQIDELMGTWLGDDIKNLSIPIPAVIAFRTSEKTRDLPGLSAELGRSAPGVTIEDHALWSDRLQTLSQSLIFYAGLALVIVAAISIAVIAAATRSELMTRREAVLIVFQLGATEGYIAQRFATRTAAVTSVGGMIGGLLALTALLALITIATPIVGVVKTPQAFLGAFSPLPLSFWLLPVLVPLVVGSIGYATAHAMMRYWLRKIA